jgi:hypothetical protein
MEDNLNKKWNTTQKKWKVTSKKKCGRRHQQKIEDTFFLNRMEDDFKK